MRAWSDMATGLIRICYDPRNYKHAYKTPVLISVLPVSEITKIQQVFYKHWNVNMKKFVKQFQTTIKQNICIHLYTFVSEIISLTTDGVFVCRAAEHPQHKCSASHTSTTQRSVLPIGFHEVIHFSSHTLTFIPNTLLMRVGGGWWSERLAGHKIAPTPHSDTPSLPTTGCFYRSAQPHL